MEEDDDDRSCPLVAFTMQMGVFGQPVWPQALRALLEVTDHSAWDGQMLAEVDFKPNGGEPCLDLC